MQIQWTCTGKDKHGAITKITLTGPMNADEARAHADYFHFGEMRRNAVRAGAEDPELQTIEGPEGVVRVGDNPAPFGQFRPPGVKVLDLNKYVPKNDKRDESTDEIDL